MVLETFPPNILICNKSKNSNFFICTEKEVSRLDLEQKLKTPNNIFLSLFDGKTDFGELPIIITFVICAFSDHFITVLYTYTNHIHHVQHGYVSTCIW